LAVLLMDEINPLVGKLSNNRWGKMGRVSLVFQVKLNFENEVSTAYRVVDSQTFGTAGIDLCGAPWSANEM